MATDSKPMGPTYPSPHTAPVGTAYAYPGPPPYGGPHPGAPPYYPPAPGYGIPVQNNSTHFLRRVILIFITMFALLSTLSLIITLIQRPQFPDFSVSSASVSSFNLSSSSPFFSSDFDLTFSIQNPNKHLVIYYERIAAVVLYGHDVLVDETPLPDFYQGKENETTLRARLPALKQYVEPETVEGITGDRARGGVVEFEVRLRAVVKFSITSWIGHVIRVYCDDVKIGLGNGTVGAGAMVGPPKRCIVKL